jgi:hypothetical protein
MNQLIRDMAEQAPQQRTAIRAELYRQARTSEAATDVEAGEETPDA